MIDVEGVSVPRALVLELAHGLEHEGYFDTANHLLRCLSEHRPITLEAPDRGIVLEALRDPPEGLEELRGALLGRL